MTTIRNIVLAASLPLLLLADFEGGGSPAISLGRDAHAIVGAPATPVSVAGVARRTTRRTVAVTTTAAATTAAATTAAATTNANAQQQAAVAQQQAATAQQQAAVAQQQATVAKQQAAAAGAPAVGAVVPALPAGCTKLQKEGVEYQQCGGVTYRAAFQGNNLVYVVQ